jgi:hypothetical protein
VIFTKNNTQNFQRKKTTFGAKSLVMNRKIILAALALVLSLSACKNEKSLNELPVVETQQVQTFNVALDVTVKQNDSFQIYYTEADGENYSEDKSIWVDVKGQDSPQKVVFNLPADVIPALIRLDFGVNDNQQDVVLHSVSLDFAGKNFTTSGPSMANYFRIDGPTNFDFSTGVIKAMKKDGKRIEPVLYPHEAVISQEIQKLLK